MVGVAPDASTSRNLKKKEGKKGRRERGSERKTSFRGTKLELSNAVTTSHMWLFKLKFIEIKYNFKCSSIATVAKFLSVLYC